MRLRPGHGPDIPEPVPHHLDYRVYVGGRRAGLQHDDDLSASARCSEVGVTCSTVLMRSPMRAPGRSTDAGSRPPR